MTALIADNTDSGIIRQISAERERLKRMVARRLDKRLARRVDASDVVQDAILEATSRVDEFLARQNVPLIVWLRSIADQKVTQTHRFHLATEKRATGREAVGHQDCEQLVSELSASLQSPHSVLVAAEFREQLHSRIGEMSDLDREILLLKHVEELTTAEAAAELEIGVEAAKKRYRRAIRRLGDVIREAGDGESESS